MRKKSGRRIHGCACPHCRRHPYSVTAKQHRAINRVLATLNEKNRRRFVGLLALQRGWGGIRALIEIGGMSRNTICRGRDEIQRSERVHSIRQAGGGRHRVEKNARRS